jgi:hypothetical protein
MLKYSSVVYQPNTSQLAGIGKSPALEVWYLVGIGAFLKTLRHKNICPFTVNICLFNLQINPIFFFEHKDTKYIQPPCPVVYVRT